MARFMTYSELTRPHRYCSIPAKRRLRAALPAMMALTESAKLAPISSALSTLTYCYLRSYGSYFLLVDFGMLAGLP